MEGQAKTAARWLSCFGSAKFEKMFERFEHLASKKGEKTCMKIQIANRTMSTGSKLTSARNEKNIFSHTEMLWF